MNISGYNAAGSIDLRLYSSNSRYAFEINTYTSISQVYLCSFFNNSNRESYVAYEGTYVNISDKKVKKNIEE